VENRNRKINVLEGECLMWIYEVWVNEGMGEYLEVNGSWKSIRKYVRELYWEIEEYWGEEDNPSLSIKIKRIWQEK
jgi:hypothetical protein